MLSNSERDRSRTEWDIDNAKLGARRPSKGHKIDERELGQFDVEQFPYIDDDEDEISTPGEYERGISQSKQTDSEMRSVGRPLTIPEWTSIQPLNATYEEYDIGLSQNQHIEDGEWTSVSKGRHSSIKKNRSDQRPLDQRQLFNEIGRYHVF